MAIFRLESLKIFYLTLEFFVVVEVKKCILIYEFGKKAHA